MRKKGQGAQLGLKFGPPFLLLLLGVILSFFQTFQRWDRFVYDYLLIAMARPQSEHIAIIAIDEKSLEQYGRWPWPRNIHAELIDKLSMGGAKVIGFDLIIAEPDTANPERDHLLAGAVSRNEQVIVPVISEMHPSEKGLRLTTAIPVLSSAAAGFGHVDFELDSDGIMRRVFLRAGHGKPTWDAMSLAMLQLTNPSMGQNLPGRRNPSLHTAAAGNWVRDFEVLLPFAGPPGHFERISYADFMADDFDPGIVSGKYVFIGTTAIGLGDTLPTPVSGESVPMAGVEINANLLDALQQGVTVTPMTTTGRVLLTALLVLLPLSLYPRLSQRGVQTMVLLSLVFCVLISLAVMVKLHIWFPPVAAFSVILLSYPLWAWSRLEQLVRSLFREKEKALVTLHSIGDGVITTDNDGWVEYMNPVAEKLTGYTADGAQRKHLKDILPLVDEDIGRDQTVIVDDCLRKSQVIHLEEEAIFKDRSGNERALQVSAGPIHDQDGTPMGVVLGVSDVTEKRRALRELSYRATHDFLTGLPNRSLLTDRLHQAISRARRSKSSIAVLFLDLDNFKKTNDQLGHDGGDQLLKLVGKRLVSACRDEDTVARLGGDEFVVLLESVSNTALAAGIADKFIHLLEEPFLVDNQDLYITGSIGISVFPKDSGRAEDLMKNADIAMYEVKKQGRNGYLFFSSEMNELIQERLTLESKLRVALKNDELQLHYQPQVLVRDGRLFGVEALLRWPIEGKGSVSPGAFIPIAEESGLIVSLSEWVIYTACRQARIWQDELSRPFHISVNLSPRHFMQDDLPDQLDRIIRDTGIDRKYLDLEITEGLIMQDVDRSVEILREFKKKGGTVSIDDFGTGYSSLAYLKHFPLDKLKIDKAFIENINTDTRDEGLARTIINMGHSLNLKIVAEGVETNEQLAILKTQKCDIIQGYFYSRPLLGEELTPRLKQSFSFG